MRCINRGYFGNSWSLVSTPNRRPPSGLATNSIMFCLLFIIKDQCKKVGFQGNTQSRNLLVVSIVLRLLLHALQCLCVSVVPDVTHKARLRVPCQLKKPFKGLRPKQIKLPEGTEESNILTRGSLICLFCTKGKQNKIA